MRSQAQSQDTRKAAMDANRRTNFIGQSGKFEDEPKKFAFAAVPDKGTADTDQVKSMIDNLRKEHFDLGKQKTMFYNSSHVVGRGTQSAQKDPRQNWGVHNKTNYPLGIDSPAKATDYNNRFAHTQTAFKTNQIAVPYDESKQNKAKIESDSIKIAGNNIQSTAVSSKLQF